MSVPSSVFASSSSDDKIPVVFMSCSCLRGVSCASKSWFILILVISDLAEPISWSLLSLAE